MDTEHKAAPVTSGENDPRSSVSKMKRLGRRRSTLVTPTRVRSRKVFGRVNDCVDVARLRALTDPRLPPTDRKYNVFGWGQTLCVAR